MKKYRLKQWYPSLLKNVRVGDIITENVQHYKGVTHKGINYRVEIWQLHPDFWELIEEKEPLFITEDGVEVFDENEYIAIGSDFSKIDMVAYNCDAPYSSDVIRFKHESNADEYIRLNKKDYSLNDIERNIESLAKNLGYRLIKVQNDSQWTPAPEDCTCWKIKEKSESSSKCEAEKIDGRCPKCGGELEYSHIDRVLLSNPPQRQINCTKCAHVGYLIERSER